MSWPLVKLDEIFDVARGGSPRPIQDYITDDSDGINWVMISDATDSSKYITKTKKKIKPSGLKKSRMVQPGDFLLTNSMSFGRPYIMNTTGCIHDGWLVLSPKSENIDTSYFYHLFGSNAVYRHFSSVAAGAVVKNLNIDLVKALEIPLPPLPEQKRIAAILDKADSLRRKNQQAIQLADKFLRAVFLNMFGDPVTNPKGFSIGSIRDLIESANYGTSAKASETEGEFPMLRMGNITYEGGWDFSDLKYIDLSEREHDKYLVKKGDLLFNRTNSKELVGKTAVYERDDAMAIAGYLIRVRTNEYGNPYYISAYLNSKHGKTTLLNMCKSIVGMANINAQELQDIKILMPPKTLQDRFEQIVISTNKKLKSFHQSKNYSDKMFLALSQKAFSGNLRNKNYF